MVTLSDLTVFPRSRSQEREKGRVNAKRKGWVESPHHVFGTFLDYKEKSSRNKATKQATVL